MSSIQALTQMIASMEKTTADAKALLSTLNPCPERHCAACPHGGAAPAAPAAAVAAPVIAAPRRPRAPLKDFGVIQRALTGSQVYVESLGDRWIGTITDTGILYEGKTFTSPTGFCAAHAARITEAHPQPTETGSGWQFVKMLEGQHRGKPLSFVYQSLQAQSAPEAEADESPRPRSPLVPAPLIAQAEESAESAETAATLIAAPTPPPAGASAWRGEFVCMRNPKHTPEASDIEQRGGILEGGKFRFYNRQIPEASSSSGACCAVLKRREGSTTNQWDGPKHVFLMIGGTWRSYSSVFPSSVSLRARERQQRLAEAVPAAAVGGAQ